MALQVSDDSRKRTKKCSSNFLCLSNEKNPLCSKKRPLCPVEIALESMIFVKSKNNDCVYKEEYGAGYLCTCPVRFEIYNRYKM
jgi:hypothetical protein